MFLLKITRYLFYTGMSMLLLACETVDTSQSSQIDFEGPESTVPIVEESATTGRVVDPFLRARILADMLYEASLAFDDNRLMFPAGNNAYDGYLEVLSFEPDNQVALQGIEAIVDRYVAMANQAIGNGQFDDAQEYLNRASRINPDKQTITEARILLQQERSVSRDYFALDPQALDDQSVEILSQLGSIGELVRNYDATFLITARTDAEGRWIYRIMREAVGGYRLRGNITLGNQPTIQVNIPQS